MNGSFVFVSGEANFIHKVRNRILTEKERHNKSAHTHAHTQNHSCFVSTNRQYPVCSKHAEELKNHPKWRVLNHEETT